MALNLNWINPGEYSFQTFLLLERFQIRLMMEWGGWHSDKDEWRRCMGIALRANPAVRWYLEHRCPECAPLVSALASGAPAAGPEEVRNAEAYALMCVEDFTVYTTPAVMAERCDFIRGWDKTRLFGLAELAGKTVLDVGAGSGRLTFAAAEKAAFVYASEPVGTLREFMRDKIAEEGIRNVRVLDGFADSLPFPDDTFDVVMSGHVVGETMTGSCPKWPGFARTAAGCSIVLATRNGTSFQTGSLSAVGLKKSIMSAASARMCISTGNRYRNKGIRPGSPR